MNKLARTMARDLGAAVGTTVRVCGLVEDLSDDDGHRWARLRDVTGEVPLFRGRSGSADPIAGILAAVGLGSAVEAVGQVMAGGEAGPDAGFHLDVTELDVVGPAMGALPVDGSSTLSDRLDWRFVDLRRPRNRLIFEVQTTAEEAMRAYWHEHG
ncbi:MAG: hypothetical protein M3137_11140, partial [Actinomycetota bacterium]|nr:hypothetical protein [Actinomycetota bacterium]